MTKILIVDDEEDIIELLDDHLSEHGFDVISAEDGATALAQIYRERPDVVLLDLKLPVVNGYEVLKEIRSDSRTKNLPVILLTGVSPVEGEQTAVELGANHYVTKPWKMGTLRDVIKVAIREVGRSSWTRPSASHLQNVNRFRADQAITAPVWRRRL